MTEYERGFEAGEWQAFKDRRTNIRRTRPTCLARGGFDEGFWDAYTPRSTSWSHHGSQTVFERHQSLMEAF